MAWSTMTAQLKLDIADFSAKLKTASNKMSNFAAEVNRDYGKATAALKSHNLGLKDTARIVQGIMVSQVFYGAVQSISSATSALWDFNVALDYMHVTYSALFNDSDRATRFMEALQEHSIETIFDYQSLADASKKLMAYGIEYENLMYIMEGLTNLGAMSGDPAALDRLALALGQIYTKGKLSGEEMRQLANAYIPITDILQDKFGLTGDDLKNVSDLNIPAADVINAIVEYANENFASVGDAAMYTITGLQNRIVDTLKVVGSEMLKPITTAYKSFLMYISKGLEEIRAAFDAGGLGGVFEHLVPDESTQQKIRQFIANVKNLLMALASVAVAAGNAFGQVISVVVTAFNILSPLVTGFINTLAAFINAMLETSTGAAILRIALIAAAGAFAILKIQAVGALIISAVTTAITGLSKALLLLGTIIVKHPVLAILTGIAAALIGVSGLSQKAGDAIGGVFDKISEALGGSSSDDILQKTEQELHDNANAADEFNNALNSAAGGAENLEEALGGANKEAKKTRGLLSFDEVYKLPDPADSTAGLDSGLLGALEDLEGALGNLGDGLIPEVPDFGEFFNDFTDNLFGGLKDSIMSRMGSAGIGALIGAGLGAILGGILGGPAGAKIGAAIGALAGGIVGWFWEDLKGAFTGSNTLIGGLSGIGGVIAGALAKIPITIGAGTFTGWFSAIATAFKNAGLKNIVKGGLIGAAIGFVVDAIASLLWQGLADKFSLGESALETAKIGQNIGSIIGALIGGILFGPAGAIIGSAIGTFAGGLTGLFWETIGPALASWGQGILDAFTKPFIDFGTMVSAMWNELVVAPFKAAFDGSSETWWQIGGNILAGILGGIVAAISTVATAIGTVFVAIFNAFLAIFGIHSPATAMEPIGVNILLGVLSGMLSAIPLVIEGILPFGVLLVETIASFFDEMGTNIAEWATEAFSDVKEFASKAGNSIRTFSTEASNKVSTFVTNTTSKIKQWATNVSTNTTTAMTKFKTAISTGVSNAAGVLSSFCSTTLSKISGWASSIGNVVSSVWQRVVNFISQALDSLRNAGNRVVSYVTNSASNGINFGHASGGVFNREHVARFAEGNKAEAIIPLEEKSAMQPFVDAVAGGLLQTLGPMIASASSNATPAYAGVGADTLPPMYVGTLIADERGLKELERKMRIIRVKEEKRGNR